MTAISSIQILAVFCFTNTCYIVPDSTAPMGCPNTSDPCVTLSQFVASPTTYAHDSAHVDLVFLPGNHYLQSNLTLQDYQEVLVFSMLGRRSPIGVTINGNGLARLELSEVSEVRIEHIQFQGFSSSKVAYISDSVLINNCSFVNGNGTAVELEYNGDVTISNSQFISNVGTLREVTQTSVTGQLYSAGGALFVLGDDSILIERCKFINNSADVGGVIYSTTSYYTSRDTNINIRNCSFLDNVLLFSSEESTDYNNGVLIFCEVGTVCRLSITTSFFGRNTNMQGLAMFAVMRSTVLVQYSVFDENHGAIMNAESSSVRLRDNNFSRNVNAHLCGGLFQLSSSSLTISKCNFIENSHFAENESGGVVCGERSRIITSYSNFTRNHVNTSGGVYYLDYQSSLLTNHSVYDSNDAAIYGGVVYAIGSNSVEAHNNTFCKNSAMISGGVFKCDGEKSILILQNNSFLQNHANISGGVFQVSYNNISMYNNLFNYNYANIGGVIEASGGNILIDSCTFTQNHANNVGGVGALYIVTFIVMQSKFTANTADSGGVFFINGVEENSVIQSSAFLLNEADDLGAVIFGDSVKITLHFLNFMNNSAPLGVVYCQSCGYLHVQDINFNFNRGSFFTFNSKIIIEGFSTFSFSITLQSRSNTDVDNHGGALTCIQTELTINNSAHVSFEGNQAKQGGGMMLTETKLNIINSFVIFVDNYASVSGGGMYCYQSEIVNEGHIFLNGNTATNKGGAMHMIGSRLNIPLSSFTSRAPPGTLRLSGNVAREGGGIYFEGNSKLYISKEGVITREVNENWKSFFMNNSADYGGAIFIADGTDSGTCASMSSESVQSTVVECTVQVLSLHEFGGEVYRNALPYNFEFANNLARISGSDMYGGLLDRCKASFYAEVRQVYKGSEISESDFLGGPYIMNISNIREDMISSDPVKICFCFNSTQDCQYTNYSESAMKGERITIDLVAVDQLEHPVSATIRSYLSSGKSGLLGEGQLTQYIANTCSQIEFEVSSINESEELTLYAEGPCKDIGVSKKIIEITFLSCKCPIGFKENKDINTRCDCICDDVISSLQATCDIASKSIIRQSNFWLTYLEEEKGYVVYPECPFDYCHPPTTPVSINLNLPKGADAQCKNHRMGKLCGACQPGYSTVLGNTKCLHCSDQWIALILAFMFAGVALVAFILYFNLTVAVGTINGLMFYANIITANREIYIQNSNILSVFISWLNLDLGIESCLYDGMDNYAKVWLRFVFPMYIILLVIIIIVVSERSPKFAKLLTYKNPVAALATLILLSYTQLLRTIISSFSFAILDYPDGSSKASWLPDANIYYFSIKHTLLLLTAMFIVIIGSAYTLLLFSWQWILKLNDRVFLKWIRNPRFNSFMDAYHAPYNFKYRYWTGVLLFVRVTLYIVASLIQNVFADARINLVFTTAVIAGILVCRGYLKVSILYKNWLIDVLELTFYFNIIIFTVATLYVRSAGKGNQTTVANISIGITFTLFTFIIIHHIYAYCLVKLTSWKRVTTFITQSITLFAQRYKKNNARDNIDLEEYLIDNQNQVQVTQPTASIIERFE